MTASVQPPRVAILIFAEGQARDLRRRGLSSRAAGILGLPRVALAARSARADVHWFSDHPSRPPRAGVVVHRQHGRSFGERLGNAVNELSAQGYDRLIIVGRDCPQMTGNDVSTAIDALDTSRLVIGPDHRGGCWLIGLHTADRAQLASIRWQQDTDAAELMSRFSECRITLLAQKIDVDSTADLLHLARVGALPEGLINSPVAVQVRHIVRFLSHLRQFLQLPPPARAPV